MTVLKCTQRLLSSNHSDEISNLMFPCIFITLLLSIFTVLVRFNRSEGMYREYSQYIQGRSQHITCRPVEYLLGHTVKYLYTYWPYFTLSRGKLHSTPGHWYNHFRTSPINPVSFAHVVSH